MKNNLRDKFRDFLTSEEGRVGVKAPLALGIVSGSVLLAQAMLSSTAQAHMECSVDGNCIPPETCHMQCDWWHGNGDCGHWTSFCA